MSDTPSHPHDDPTVTRSDEPAPTGGEAETMPSQQGDYVRSYERPDVPGYEVTGRLGEGGMGTVWRSVQLSTKRQVALKLMGAQTLGSEKAKRRFEREVELSATLEHPNIARVYEAGEHRGVFYYAMELIDGVPLDEHVRDGHLPADDILQLMRSVCLAVQHAHQRGVIHRDLKPSNVLVTEDGQPHVLDFGLAKPLVEEGHDPTITRTGELAGTIAYMAPEQAAGRVSEIDTRTDVYALGVILYRLLASRHPYELGTVGLHEAVRVIHDVEPASLSTVDRSLRGDVETIVGKALAKEPERRYASAQELADDIGRYLNSEPIEARPASTWYQVTKFAKRNRVLVGSAAVVFLALLAGVIGTGLALDRALDAEADARSAESDALTAKADALASAEAERTLRTELEANQKNLIAAKDEAERERATAEAVNNFLINMFKQADPRRPEVGGRRDMTVAEVLDTAAARLNKAFQDQPLVEAALRHVIGVTYRNLGEIEKSVEQHERELELRREHDDGAEPQAMISAYYATAYSLGLVDRHKEALALYETALALARQRFGPDHVIVLEIQAGMATALGYLGRRDEAEALLVSSLPKMRRVLGPRNMDTLQCLASLSHLRQAQNRLKEAERLMREAYEGMTAVVGPDHPDTLACGYGLVGLLHRMGQFEDALKLAQHVWQTKVRVLGETHPDTVKSAINLAVNLTDAGRLDEAYAQAQRALRAVSRARDLDHRTTLMARENLAMVLAMSGRPDEGIDQLLEVFKQHRRLHGEAHAMTLRTLVYLTRLMPKQGRSADLEKLALDLLSAQQQRHGDAHPNTAKVKASVGVTLVDANRHARAEPLLREALADLPETTYPAGHPLRLQAREHLAVALRQRGEVDEAAAVLRDALGHRIKHEGPAATSTVMCYTELGTTFLASGRHQPAFDLMLDTLPVQPVQGPAGLNQWHISLLITHRALTGLRKDAKAHGDQADPSEVEARFRGYVQRCEEAVGSNHPATLCARFALAMVLHDLEQEDEGIKLAAQVLAQRRQLERPSARAMTKINVTQTVVVWLHAQGQNQKGRGTKQRMAGNLAAALPFYRKALHTYRAAGGEKTRNELDTYNWLGRTLTELGRHDEAVEVLTAGVRAQREAGKEAADILQAGRFWLWFAKAGDGGLAMMAQLTRENLGVDDPITLSAMVGRGNELLKKKPEQAAELFREALAGHRRVYGERHPGTLGCWNLLGQSLVRANRLRDAIVVLDEAIEHQTAAGSDGAPYRKSAETWLGSALKGLKRQGVELLKQSKAEEAAAMFQDSLAGSRRILGDDHSQNLDTWNWLGRSLLQARRYEEALAVLDEAIKHQTAAGPAGERYLKTAQSWRRLAVRALQAKQTSPKPSDNAPPNDAQSSD